MADLPKSVAELREAIVASVLNPKEQGGSKAFFSNLDKLCALAAPNAKLREAAERAAWGCKFDSIADVWLVADDVTMDLRDALSAAPEAAKADEVAELRARLEAAEGSLDTLRNFLSQIETNPDIPHPAKLPVGRVIGLVNDLRADLAAARADVARLTETWDHIRDNYVDGDKAGDHESVRQCVDRMARDLAAARADQRAVAVAALDRVRKKIAREAAPANHTAYNVACDNAELIVAKEIAAVTAPAAEPARQQLLGKMLADAAGGALSMVQCNYDSVDFPRQVVEALDAIDTRLRALETNDDE